MAAGEKSNPAI